MWGFFLSFLRLIAQSKAALVKLLFTLDKKE